MRRFVDIVVLVGTLAMLGGILHYRAGREQVNAQVSAVAEDVRRLEVMIKYQAATGNVELTGRGWPATIDPSWFGEDPPSNSLLSPLRPWVEVVTPEQADLLHPEFRIATDSDQAMFWYNPYQGVVRARVPPVVNDRAALEMYNRVNRCEIDSLLDPAPRVESATANPPANPASHPVAPEPSGSEARPEMGTIPSLESAG